MTGSEGAWMPPYITKRIRFAPLPDAWLAATANAYDVQARTQLDAAKELVLDRPYRHKRKARHLAQANEYARHARALRELLLHRQDGDRLPALSSKEQSPVSEPQASAGNETEGGSSGAESATADGQARQADTEPLHVAGKGEP